ncbi:DUF5999 family protein [Paractinoplanes maris]|uniref:DUF5999 family protein n=1 Tax=Paractinoplanes maris TaxID=1734446 RepID=UPI002021673E|nr:DUF5999 family protein [Actinoplanes maris]
MCNHTPECPAVDQPGWETAAQLVHHDDLGWSMLCNGAIVLDAAVRPEPAPVPVPAVTEMPVRARRARTRTRTRQAVPAPARRPVTEPIAA